LIAIETKMAAPTMARTLVIRIRSTDGRITSVSE
jgi:hypothetical protein